MKNNGLFSKLFIESLKETLRLDDHARGRMAALYHAWQNRDGSSRTSLWDTFIKQAVGYLLFTPPNNPSSPGVYPLYEDWGFSKCISVLLLAEPGASLDDMRVGKFLPGVLIGELKRRKLTWGILTNGARWRLYSTKTGKPYENYAELNLSEVIEDNDEQEYGTFERFFQRESFVPQMADYSAQKRDEETPEDGIYACRLDEDGKASEKILEVKVKTPLLTQIDEVLQYLCNGFIADTPRKGEEYTEEERREIFESAVKLFYRCLFLFYAEARSLLPSEDGKVETYRSLSIRNLCEQARDFHWGKRKDNEEYTLWKHLKGLVNAVNDGDPEYGIMGYDGGLFDDREEKYLGEHRLRNDFLARALYLLAFVEPYDVDPEKEYPIPYEDLEVRHIGEMYENILEYTVLLADADRLRRKTKKGVEILLASHTTPQKGDTWIRKGDVFFGATALERKQTGSFYTPETLVSFLNEKAIIRGLRERFDKEYRDRFEGFLKEARSGYDDNIRRGAAQSAIALVERFVHEVVLLLKVCDPAMGSGHFLVNGSNQITALIIDLLAEIPSVEGVRSDITSQPNYWRRLITRNCLYGVDLNPLAVHLAKLSLWLNSFAREHRLTFLDHHIKCGNSLVGIRSLEQLRHMPEHRKKKDMGKGTLFSLPEKLNKDFEQAIGEITSIGKVDEDDTDRQKRLYDDSWTEGVERLTSLGDLYTAYLMDSTIGEDSYRDLFIRLARGEPPSWSRETELLKKVKAFKKKHHFFHWALEFPDVFCDRNAGFHTTTGNPPWDVLQPSTQEFYSQYDPYFRKYKKQEANRIIRELQEKNPEIQQKWAEYEKMVQDASSYAKEPGAFVALAYGKIDLYKAFLERFFQLLSEEGAMGIVVPSGFYTDQGCQPLRELFFNKSSIDCLYCFENRRAIFNIHRSFKFILFVTHKGGSTNSFKCAFMQHDPERLGLIDTNPIISQANHIKKFSPISLNVMEFRSQQDINITEKIYDSHPLLGDKTEESWICSLTQDFNLTSDSHLFNREGYGIPLYEGKSLFIFDHLYSDIGLWIEEEYVKEKFVAQRWQKLVKKGTRPEKVDYEFYRGAFRRIAASTNERTFIGTVLPSNTVCPHTTFTIQRVIPDKNGNPFYLINSPQTVFLISVLNSFVMDYVIRMKISTGLDMHFIYSLPVERLGVGRKKDLGLFWPVVRVAIRLICVAEEYKELWAETHRLVHEYRLPEVSYPLYGPSHEQEIRRCITEQAASLTKDWTPACGVYDRTKDRRDTGDRAQLRAEIDAYVAHFYGLTRNDFAYILDTFPVLKKKEEQVFGEFMSKRKCLEEYDRIATIL